MSNSFAIITGAANGLGKAFAIGCARRGYHLLLIDLPGTRLERIGRHIGHEYGTHVLTLEQDLCDGSAIANISRLVREQDIEVSMLINNAGLGLFRPFQDMGAHEVNKILRLNTEVPTTLSLAMLPWLKQSKKGTIINVSSVASFFNLPTKSIYVASKAYLRYLSQSLRIELRQAGVQVCVVCPGGLRTNASQYLQARSNPWLIRQTALLPEQAAEEALRGALDGKALVIPGRLNRIIFYGTSWFPSWLKAFLAGRTMKAVNPNRAVSPLFKYM